MKKLLRYLVNTILFVVLWFLMFLPVMKYSIDMGATSVAAIGGIVAIIISYKVVKTINKSNLWASLFDKEEVVNEKTDLGKQVKSSSYNWKLISIVALVLVAILVYFNMLNPPKFQPDEDKMISNDNNNLKEVPGPMIDYTLYKRYNVVETNYDKQYAHARSNLPQAKEWGFLLLNNNKQPVTGVVYGSHMSGLLPNQELSHFEALYKNGVLDGISKTWEDNGTRNELWYFRNNILERVEWYDNNILKKTTRYQNNPDGSYRQLSD